MARKSFVINNIFINFVAGKYLINELIMPTNLPPEYFEAERKFRSAESISAKVDSLEELIATIPKHKGTDKLRADLRRKLSKLKSEHQKKKGTGKHDSIYHIEKEGAGRAVLVGPANVGKSALVAALTHATPKVSEYPFTTWVPLPGMMTTNDVQIQLIDTPPLSTEHVEPELFDLIRSSDLILFIVDLQASPRKQLEETLMQLKNHKIAPDNLKHLYTDSERIFFYPALLVVNKNDNPDFDEDFEIFRELLEDPWRFVPVSAASKRNLDEFGKACFDKLEVIRIYSKPPGKEPDMSQPFVIKRGSTVGELAGKVHKDFIRNFKTARIWGNNVYDGQLVGRDHILQDRDIVELHA